VLRISSRSSLLGPAGVLAAVLASAGGLAQAQESRVVVPHQHGPASLRHLRYDGAAESTNWGGYAVTGANGSVTSVSGSWVVPASTCSQGATPEYASFWIGIDGWTSSTVEQIGTDSDCSNGKPSYYAWFEFYPQPAYYAGSLTNLTPGHLLSATVSYNTTTGAFTATITDQSEPALTFSTTYTPSTGFRGRNSAAPLRSSAEWIAEAPSSSRGVLPLADFSKAYFGDGYTNLSNTCFATVNGVSGTIGSFGSNVWSATMIDEKTEAPKATPSSLGFNGSSFYVTWDNVGP